MTFARRLETEGPEFWKNDDQKVVYPEGAPLWRVRDWGETIRWIEKAREQGKIWSKCFVNFVFEKWHNLCLGIQNIYGSQISYPLQYCNIYMNQSFPFIPGRRAGNWRLVFKSLTVVFLCLIFTAANTVTRRPVKLISDFSTFIL